MGAGSRSLTLEVVPPGWPKQLGTASELSCCSKAAVHPAPPRNGPEQRMFGKISTTSLIQETEHLPHGSATRERDFIDQPHKNQSHMPKCFPQCQVNPLIPKQHHWVLTVKTQMFLTIFCNPCPWKPYLCCWHLPDPTKCQDKASFQPFLE